MKLSERCVYMLYVPNNKVPKLSRALGIVTLVHCEQMRKYWVVIKPKRLQRE